MQPRPGPTRSDVVSEPWTLDKRVPLALILAVVGSTLTVGATAVIAHYRLGTVETRIERLEVADRQQDRDSVARERLVAETVGELRGAVSTLREAVTDLRTTIRQARQ